MGPASPTPAPGIPLCPWSPRSEARVGGVLTVHLCLSAGETIQGLRSSLLAAIDTLSRVDSSVAVSSGGELFLRFISLTSLEYSVRAAAACPTVLPAGGTAAPQQPALCFPGLLQVQGNHDRARGDLPEESVSLSE